MITDYTLRGEKRAIQRRVLPFINEKKVVTLAGPNVLDYVSIYPVTVREFEIWENDPKVMLLQLPQLQKVEHRKIAYRFGDILNAEVDTSAFYDLDFCCTIKTIDERFSKFSDCRFTATFSLRWSSISTTINSMLSLLGERKVSEAKTPYCTMLRSNKSNYIYTVYNDVRPMIHITKM